MHQGERRPERLAGSSYFDKQHIRLHFEAKRPLPLLPVYTQAKGARRGELDSSVDASSYTARIRSTGAAEVEAYAAVL
jgi:hypothetical protein